jgi:2'-5' RNA ligase
VVIVFAAVVPAPPVLRAVETTVGGGDPEALRLRPLNDLNVTIARFGNTTFEDADRLIGTLTSAAEEWSPMQLSLGGASVVETPAERTLSIEVRGDVEALHRLSLDVKQAAERMRFLLDRRDFSPVVTLASVRPGGADGIDAAAAALATFESDSWLQTSISIRKQTFGDDNSSEELAQVPLGSA